MVLTVNTDCSGMEAPIQALRNLRVPHQHLFSCDIDRHARSTISANFPPKIMYEDITKRDNSQAPTCDLYVAGFPCQPFSSAGLQQGFADQRGRGKIFFNVLDYIREKSPKVFVLENVSGLVRIDQGRYFAAILRQLDLLGNYSIHHSLLDTKHHGVPHSRRRIYMVGIRKDVDRGTFQFPAKIEMPSIEKFLDPRCPKQARTGLPPSTQSTATANVTNALRALQASGRDPFREPFIIDCDSSVPRSKWLEQCSPCITCSRGKGHWLTNRGRRMTLAEMLRLQGMDPNTFKQVVSDSQLGKQIGNAMSVNVLERLLVRLLPAAGLMSASRLQDRWEDGSAADAFHAQASGASLTKVPASPSSGKRRLQEPAAASPAAKRPRAAAPAATKATPMKAAPKKSLKALKLGAKAKRKAA